MHPGLLSGEAGRMFAGALWLGANSSEVEVIWWCCLMDFLGLFFSHARKLNNQILLDAGAWIFPSIQQIIADRNPSASLCNLPAQIKRYVGGRISSAVTSRMNQQPAPQI